MFQKLIVPFMQVTLLSFILTTLVRHIARHFQLFDKDPHDIQKGNQTAVSYGGVAIYLSFWIGSILTMPYLLTNPNQLWLLLASTIVLVVGIIDDAIELRPWQKTIGILVAANVLYFQAGIEFSSALLPNLDPSIFQILSYIATMLWIFGVTNAINLIDGVDGLASSVTVVSLLTLTITTYFFSLSIRMSFLMMLLLLIASIMGFLPFNWAPASIYLGDTGALFIGFMYAALSVSNLKSASLYSLLVPVLIYLLPIFDASYAMLRRILTRKAIGQADQEHLHHRLLRFGFSKKQVVYAMISFTFIFSILAIASYIWTELRFFWLLIALLVVLGLMRLMYHLSKKR
ncbi:undecaprenyl/decaprenyl-phosphate alpha-N-acetylglucosaminyl 1-phosphate transferase [Aerococcaceae bacterium zg-ZJ1578]|uniref:MraY family glycosyltransferase n=1 Tax=Aerococcaceae bacterium zg-252 TaxID=2796928 RepID=UPI001A23AA46|nr:undecaprenyl/decaprenyl-phosphate alpha-N-acetylglucosaminyl 1-phosphate transferase [Aerococcaceae bacterium zg-1578]